VTGSVRRFESGFVCLREDTLLTPDGDAFDRVVVEHKGAVGVVALDDADRVLLLRQYRHAVGGRLLELPAGIRDVDGEEPRVTAARELAEEAGVVAGHWTDLVQMWSSPGMTDEHWHVYLVRDLTAAAPESVPAARHEEAYLEVVWVPLADAVAAVLEHRMQSPMAVAGLLAAWAHRPS